VAIAKILQHTRRSEACEAGAASKPEQRVFDDVVEMMRGAKQLETEGRTLLGKKSVAGSTQISLRSGTLPRPASEHARHPEGGAEGRDETGVFRRSFTPYAVIEMQDPQSWSHGLIRPERTEQVDRIRTA
jgi:hypothetical protein